MILRESTLKLKCQQELIDMIYKYDYKGYKYIPIHLNSLFRNGFGFKESMFIDKEFFERVESEVKDASIEKLIFDFANVLIIEQRGIMFLNEIFKNKKCIITNTNKLIYERIQKESNLENIIENEGIWYNKELDYEEIKLLKKSNDIVTHILRNYYLMPETVPLRETFIDSSNVYANKYLDVKKLFYKPHLYNLAVYELCRIIYDNYQNSFDKILCVSMNGAALGAQVSQILGKDLLLIMNLGPHLSLRDKEIFNKIRKGVKYLFLGDMICMGTEIKLAKTIISIKDANWIGGVTIFKYLEPQTNKPNKCIIDIFDNDETDKNLCYSLSIKKIL